MKNKIWEFLVDEDGQAMTEYVILVAAIIVGVGFFWEGSTALNIPGMRDAISAYYRRIVTLVSLPIP